MMNNSSNPHFVKPEVFLIGYTGVDPNSLTKYLEATNQLEFMDDVREALDQGLDWGEVLCSFYAKLCYASLTDNLKNVINSGHGSILEHVQLNFVITNCSRVFTHELVRSRVGVAFSQTSGRYVRSDELNVVIDPILEPAYDLVEKARVYLEDWYREIQCKLKVDEVKDFATKKKITSALRRLLPNGQSNEIGVSLNLRSLRHIIEIRTSRFAEWEIRYVFNQVYNLVKNKYQVMFFDAKEEMVDGLVEITFANRKV
jgi:thymidylate synthase (FAD)